MWKLPVLLFAWFVYLAAAQRHIEALELMALHRLGTKNQEPEIEKLVTRNQKPETRKQETKD